jgi:cytosine/adenosine deaminase-related metal-dependent hydrolase
VSDRVPGAVWCELAWLGEEQAERGVLIELEAERIGAITTGVASAPPEAAPLAGLTVPGLANAHSHAFQRAMRGRAQSERGDFWTWRQRMYALAEAIDPDLYRSLARATFGEMALAGITAVGEFHYLHHGPGGERYEDPNATGKAVIEAAREAGIRITLLDTCYLHGGIEREPEGAQLRFSDGSAEGWAERVDPEAAAEVAALAAERSWPLHAHVSEQPAENEDCRAAYGTSPTGLLGEAGALTERFTAVHATHPADDDFGQLATNDCHVCLCPTTERDLADGVGPARRLTEAGVELCLGTDSHAAIDMFEEARAVELDERLETGVRGGHSAAELLRAASAGGYASIGWPEGGRIEPGALADLVTVRLDGVRLAGTTADHALESLVFAASAADVRQVIVGGRFVVRDGSHLDLDVPAALKRAIGALPA